MLYIAIYICIVLYIFHFFRIFTFQFGFMKRNRACRLCLCCCCCRCCCCRCCCCSQSYCCRCCCCCSCCGYRIDSLAVIKNMKFHVRTHTESFSGSERLLKSSMGVGKRGIEKGFVKQFGESCHLNELRCCPCCTAFHFYRKSTMYTLCKQRRRRSEGAVTFEAWQIVQIHRP